MNNSYIPTAGVDLRALGSLRCSANTFTRTGDLKVKTETISAFIVLLRTTLAPGDLHRPNNKNDSHGPTFMHVHAFWI